jgi:hypothetical protein
LGRTEDARSAKEKAPVFRRKSGKTGQNKKVTSAPDELQKTKGVTKRKTIAPDEL